MRTTHEFGNVDIILEARSKHFNLIVAFASVLPIS